MSYPRFRIAFLTFVLLAILGLTASLQAQAVESLGSVGRATRDQPILIVLVHGDTPPAGQNGDPGVPEPTTGTLDHSRFYWGYDFVRRLMGVSTGIGLKTLSGTSLTGGFWDAHNAVNGSRPVRFLYAANENTLDDHFLVRGDFTGNQTPPLSALLTYRVGTTGVIDQSRDVIRQVYAKYTAKFGTARAPIGGRTLPNIVFVTHSMGGLTVRTLLTAPEDPISGRSLTARDRAKAAALRDKTLYAIMLAGPHEGSPLADRGADIRAAFNNMPEVLVLAMNLPVRLVSADYDMRREINRSLGLANLVEIRKASMIGINRGVLNPDRARCTNGTLVPIYALIGHTPAGRFFTKPRDNAQFPNGGIGPEDLLTVEGRREAFRSAGMMALDYIFHNLPGEGTTRWEMNTNDSLDKVSRVHRKVFGLQFFGDVVLPEPGEEQGLPFGFPKFYRRAFTANTLLGGGPQTEVVVEMHDGEADSDGLVDVHSGLGFRLGTSTDAYFDHTVKWPQTGRVNDYGSWYRLSSDDAPWEFTNHETIHRNHQTGRWLFVNIIQQAGPLCSDEELSVWPNPLLLSLRLFEGNIPQADLDQMRGRPTRVSLKFKKVEEDED